MEVRLLGSGGFTPSDRRETACALSAEGRRRARDRRRQRRTPARQPARAASRQSTGSSVVLTHFHLDHTLGLFYLVAAGVPIEVWAAGEALEETPTETLLPRLLGSPFAPPGFLRSFSFRELPVGEAQVGAFSVRARIQHLHSNPTLALRFDDAIAWCTDTAYDEGNVAFVRGAHTLFHEAFRPGEGTDDPTHTGASQAGRLAAAAGVERLVLIHVDPELEDDAVLVQAARAHFPCATGRTEMWRARLEPSRTASFAIPSAPRRLHPRRSSAARAGRPERPWVLARRVWGKRAGVCLAAGRAGTLRETHAGETADDERKRDDEQRTP